MKIGAEYDIVPSEVEAIEKREELQTYYAPWLAGALEIGSSMDIQHRPHGTQLLIGLSDQNESGLCKVKTIFGGHVIRVNGTSRWQISDAQTAVSVAKKVETYVLARRNHVAAFEIWDISTNDEKIWVANELRKLNGNHSLNPDLYESLVKSPAFVAGVIDARGYVSSRVDAKHETPFPHLTISSTNHALLSALHMEYGGYISQKMERGSNVLINGKPAFIHKDPYTYSLSRRKARRMLQLAQRFILLRDLEVDQALKALPQKRLATSA